MKKITALFGVLRRCLHSIDQKILLELEQITMKSWLHDGTFTNPRISKSTLVAPWLGLDLNDLFNESI